MTICLLLGVKASDGAKTEDDAQINLLCPFKLLGLDSPGGISGAYHYANMQRLELQLTKAKIIPLTYDESKPNPVHISVDVENVSAGRLGLADLKKVTILNVSRLKEDMRLHFEKRWIQDGGDLEIFQTATRTPGVFKALSKRAAFKHIKLFVYPAWINGEVISMGTYFGEPENIKLTLLK